jgi:hypothetical protein
MRHTLLPLHSQTLELPLLKLLMQSLMQVMHSQTPSLRSG